MTIILAIDPGTTQSGWVRTRDGMVMDSGIEDNDAMLAIVKRGHAAMLAIEMIASYGMAVGREVFETCVWVGRYQQAWLAWHDPQTVRLIYRRDVKLHLCGSPRANDANIRQALIDRYPSTGGGARPQIGTKGKPGPLYGMGTHTWAALGVALTAAEVAA